MAGKALDSWAIHGIAVIQSGQPYSVIDYSGAVGSIYYSTFNGITNPIVPLAPGCTSKNALTGENGAFYNTNTGQGAALKASCFYDSADPARHHGRSRTATLTKPTSPPANATSSASPGSGAPMLLWSRT